MGNKFADKLNHLFETRRRPDGSIWTPEEIQVATNKAVTSSYIWRLRAGKSTNPSYKKIETLAGFFGVDPGYFFQDDAVETPPPETDDCVAKLVETLALRARNLGAQEAQVLRDILNLIDQIRRDCQDE